MAVLPQIGSRWVLKRANAPDYIIAILHLMGGGPNQFKAQYSDITLPGNPSEFTGTAFPGPITNTGSGILSMMQQDPSTGYIAVHVGWGTFDDPGWTGFWCDVRHPGTVGLFTMLPE